MCQATPSIYEQPQTFVPRAPLVFQSFIAGRLRSANRLGTLSRRLPLSAACYVNYVDELDLDTVERRSEPRIDIGTHVVPLDLGDGRGRIDCCIWNISANGACLMVPPDVSMPSSFSVLLETGPRTAVQMWREWAYVGIKFVD